MIGLFSSFVFWCALGTIRHILKPSGRNRDRNNGLMKEIHHPLTDIVWRSVKNENLLVISSDVARTAWSGLLKLNENYRERRGFPLFQAVLN